MMKALAVVAVAGAVVALSLAGAAMPRASATGGSVPSAITVGFEDG
jgi:hypothetical protein